MAVVDDYPDLADVWKQILHWAGQAIGDEIRVEVVPPSKNAVTEIRQVRPSLVLVDAGSEGGDDVLRRLKADPQTRDIPIVGLANATIQTPAELMKMGADGVLATVDLDRVENTLRHFMPRSAK